MPPPKETPQCKETVKNKFGAKVECLAELGKEGCPNKLFHLSKYRTGQCGIGCHEGTQPINVNERALPTCIQWNICACSCHEVFDQMHAMSETIRSAINYSNYTPDRGDFVMPAWDEIAAMRTSSRDGVTTAPTRLESPAPELVPATIARPYHDTPTGRSARGELESQVHELCNVWLVDKETYNCTPKFLSEEIAARFGIRPPSVGAIDAVFKRWVKIGFAEVGTKPTRFIKYTDVGLQLTLEGCKLRYQRLQVK